MVFIGKTHCMPKSGYSVNHDISTGCIYSLPSCNLISICTISYKLVYITLDSPSLT